MNVDQCLFGYEDGHRLLASSLPLGEALSLLTELSDLAPGTLFGDSEGYWTGVPVASLGRYVLMRTWPAPEMSRPGCVWTHALLIEPRLLEAIDDLTILQSIVMRPDKHTNRARYQTKVEINVSMAAPIADRNDGSVISTLLSALYGTLTSSVEIQQPGELDAPLFAVWSQQWPRLRRNFRFQTAASRGVKTGTAVRFDALSLLASPDRYSAIADTCYPEWLTVAAKDAQCIGHQGLRAFLWRYGGDVRKQRGSFRPLTEIYVLNNNESEDYSARVFRLISWAFPDANDALRLKQDLIDGLLIPGAQAGLMQRMLEYAAQGEQVFPRPTSAGVEKLAALWPAQAETIIGLLSVTVSAQDSVGVLIQSTLLEVAKTEAFWLLSHSLPALQEVMVKSSPAFLLSSERLLDDERLATLIGFIPEDTTGLDEFISALLCRDNPDLTDAVYEHFSVRAATAVVTRLSDNKGDMSPLWMMSLIQHPSLLLQDAVLGHVPRTRLLYDIAEQLGWFSPAVFSAGIKPWLHGLVHAENDIQGEEMETLGCFLLILACHSGGEEGLQSVELFFSHLHRKLMDSTLSSRAAALLYPFLPGIGWSRDWDMALRLRIIIAEAFIKNRWPPARYFTLAKGKKERALLVKTTEGMPGGYFYMDTDLY
ncbi:hypothetical protein [Pectobacterium aroidearum]|uniref:GAP1-N1 domain-containing protein n=1 Tax=Pectobacterium aroidearum TaxID=1201031 RepID=UPI0032EB94FF